MAERVVSPAVFTNEVDQSFLAQGISQIGGAIVKVLLIGVGIRTNGSKITGRFRGPFLVFPDGKYYQPWVAREYLKHQGVVTIVELVHLVGMSRKTLYSKSSSK